MNFISTIKDSKLYNKFHSEEFKLFKQIIIYAFFGGFGAVIDIVVFYFLTHSTYHLNPVLATIISSTCGLIVSFFLNTFFNFKAKDKRVKRFFIFISIGFTGIALSAFILWSLGFVIKNSLVVKVIASFIVAAYQFVLNKFITYKGK